MEYSMEPLEESHRKAVIDIFNYYIKNSFAAYWENPVGYELFDRFLAMIAGFPALAVETDSGETVGFAFLHAYHPADSFRHTAEITYFILPDFTGIGLGSKILENLTGKAREIGIKILVASISSLNEQSIKFHQRHGFKECGRLGGIGKKMDKTFDVVWMQRNL